MAESPITPVELSQLFERLYAAYRKPPSHKDRPEAVLAEYHRALGRYPVAVVALAVEAYMADVDIGFPSIAQLRKRCRDKGNPIPTTTDQPVNPPYIPGRSNPSVLGAEGEPQACECCGEAPRWWAVWTAPRNGLATITERLLVKHRANARCARINATHHFVTDAEGEHAYEARSQDRAALLASTHEPNPEHLSPPRLAMRQARDAIAALDREPEAIGAALGGVLERTLGHDMAAKVAERVAAALPEALGPAPTAVAVPAPGRATNVFYDPDEPGVNVFGLLPCPVCGEPDRVPEPDGTTIRCRGCGQTEVAAP